MTQRLILIVSSILLLLAPVVGHAVPRTILVEKYSNGW